MNNIIGGDKFSLCVCVRARSENNVYAVHTLARPSSSPRKGSWVCAKDKNFSASGTVASRTFWHADFYTNKITCLLFISLVDALYCFKTDNT